MSAMAVVRSKAASMLRLSSRGDMVIGINRATVASASVPHVAGPSPSHCQPEVSTSDPERQSGAREAPPSGSLSTKSVATSHAPAVFRTELLPGGLVEVAGHRGQSLLQTYPFGSIGQERGFFASCCSQNG